MNFTSVLEINTSIIRDNYLILKQLSKSEVAAAVKANAYGLGATEITRTLINGGCDKFFVATLNEAIALRKHFKTIKIYSLSGESSLEESYFLEHNIIPVLNNIRQIESFNNFCNQKSVKYPAILHIDSGMNRLGVPQYEMEYLCNNLHILSNLNIEYAMSHLASSEEQDNEFNKIQLGSFNLLRKDLSNSFKKAGMNFNLKASIANSAGIFLGDNYHLDLVRPGAAIYGLQLNAKMSVFSNPVRLFSRLIQVKNLAIGNSLGYNLTHKLTRDSVIGTVPIGYADGIFRNLSNIGCCYIGDYKAKMIGRVSMDLINIDLTDIPDKLRQEGQEIDFICNKQTPSMLANDAGTIGYEVLTSLGNRYERKYLK